MSTYYRNFNKWNVKKRLINERDNEPYFKEREVWWCAFGINVGVEIDGKHDNFERPALILKIINDHMGLVVPLTTQQSVFSIDIQIRVKNKLPIAKVSQIRTISSKRLLRKICTIQETDYEQVILSAMTLITKRNPSKK